MSQLSVYTHDFIQALQVLESFTEKKKAAGEQPEREELIFGNISTSGELLLTAMTNAVCWGIVRLKLADFEGEMTDFAIHSGDVASIAASFQKTKKDSTLQLTVEHNEYESKTLVEEKVVTEIKRATRLRFMEEGKLFGSRIAQLAGADGRAYSMANIWSTAVRNSHYPANYPEFSLEPSDFNRLKKAANNYGLLTCQRLDGAIIARAGWNFIGCVGLTYFQVDKDRKPTKLEEWLDYLDAETESAPEHTLYLADEGQK